MTYFKENKNLRAASGSKLALPPARAFSWPVRVYYEDTDAGGVVYHAGYLRFFERARTEWLRAAGFDQSTVQRQYGVVFAIRAMDIEFIKPARFDDALDVSVYDVRPRSASFELTQSIQRARTLLCQAKVKAVCVEAATFQPTAIPEAITRVMNA